MDGQERCLLQVWKMTGRRETSQEPGVQPSLHHNIYPTHKNWKRGSKMISICKYDCIPEKISTEKLLYTIREFRKGKAI